MRKLHGEEKAAKLEREERLDILRGVCRRASEKLKQSCRDRRELIRTEARAKVEGAKAGRKRLREDYSELKRFERHAAERERGPGKRKRAHFIQESDDEVRQNITPELLGVWERVKPVIKGTPRISRTEAFLQYVHDNEDEVAIMMEEAMPSDDEFAAAYAEWAAAESVA